MRITYMFIEVLDMCYVEKPQNIHVTSCICNTLETSQLLYDPLSAEAA